MDLTTTFRRRANLQLRGAGWCFLFYFFSILFYKTHCKQTVETLIKRRVLRRLIWVLSYKKYSKLIWVNSCACHYKHDFSTFNESISFEVFEYYQDYMVFSIMTNIHHTVPYIHTYKRYMGLIITDPSIF